MSPICEQSFGNKLYFRVDATKNIIITVRKILCIIDLIILSIIWEYVYLYMYMLPAMIQFRQ